jgi:RNA recognition motif-containing protein
VQSAAYIHGEGKELPSPPSKMATETHSPPMRAGESNEDASTAEDSGFVRLESEDEVEPSDLPKDQSENAPAPESTESTADGVVESGEVVEQGEVTAESAEHAQVSSGDIPSANATGGEDKIPEPGTEIFIGGTGNLNEEDLHEALSRFGELYEIRVATVKQTGVRRGYGFAVFYLAAAAELAVSELNKTNFKGQMLNLVKSTSKDTLHIGMIPYTATEDDLRQGMIAHCKSAEINAMNLPTDKINSTRNRGFGFIQFRISSFAELAFRSISAKGLLVNGQRCTATWAEKNMGTTNLPARTEGIKTLFVRSVPPSYFGEEALRGLFAVYGEIEKVVIPVKDGITRDFAFVTFESAEKCQEAQKEMNGKQLHPPTTTADGSETGSSSSAPLQVDFAVGRREMSGGGGGGGGSMRGEGGYGGGGGPSGPVRGHRGGYGSRNYDMQPSSSRYPSYPRHHDHHSNSHHPSYQPHPHYSQPPPHYAHPQSQPSHHAHPQYMGGSSYERGPSSGYGGRGRQQGSSPYGSGEGSRYGGAPPRGYHPYGGGPPPSAQGGDPPPNPYAAFDRRPPEGYAPAGYPPQQGPPPHQALQDPSYGGSAPYPSGPGGYPPSNYPSSSSSASAYGSAPYGGSQRGGYPNHGDGYRQ